MAGYHIAVSIQAATISVYPFTIAEYNLMPSSICLTPPSIFLLLPSVQYIFFIYFIFKHFGFYIGENILTTL